MLKRTLDIALAGLLLFVALPLLAAAAVAISMDSRGGVIFRQARMGRRFCRFTLYKLRTMRVECQGCLYTLGDDPRITRVGRVLRWAKVDELPQLWNVLRGDMSLVGPRPVIPELATEFHDAYQRLLEVRPGLTDPATLKYCREDELLALCPYPLKQFKTVITPDKLSISLAYLEHSTIWSDLYLIVRTGVTLLFGHRLRGHAFPDSRKGSAAGRKNRTGQAEDAEVL